MAHELLTTHVRLDERCKPRISTCVLLQRRVLFHNSRANTPSGRTFAELGEITHASAVRGHVREAGNGPVLVLSTARATEALVDHLLHYKMQ